MKDSRSRHLLTALRRRTTTGYYLPELDGLRSIAISLVVLYHIRGVVLPAGAGGWLVAVADLGHYGVQAFFVVSGFAIALPFVRHAAGQGPSVRVGAFLARRVTRLEPPYLLVMFCLALLRAHAEPWADVGPHLAASMLYLHNLVYGAPSPVFIPAWTLEIDVQFYILAPFIARVFHHPERRRILLAGIIASAVFAASGRLALLLPGQLHWFLMGYLAADYYVRDALWLPRRLTRALSTGWLTMIGGMCYSVYLLHTFVLSVLARRTPLLALGHALPASAYLAAQVVALGVPIVAAGLVFFALVERPCMDRRWPQRLMAALDSAWALALARVPASTPAIQK